MSTTWHRLIAHPNNQETRRYITYIRYYTILYIYDHIWLTQCTSNNFQVYCSSMAKSLSPWPINVCTPPEIACTSSTYWGYRQVSRQKIPFPWPPLPHVQDGFPDFVGGGGKTIIWNLFEDLESASQSDIYFKLLVCNAFAKYLSN